MITAETRKDVNTLRLTQKWPCWFFVWIGLQTKGPFVFFQESDLNISFIQFTNLEFEIGLYSRIVWAETPERKFQNWTPKRKLSDVFVGNCKPSRSESVYVNTSEKPNIFVYTPAVCRDEMTQKWVTICFIQPIQKKFQWSWSVLWSLNQCLV